MAQLDQTDDIPINQPSSEEEKKDYLVALYNILINQSTSEEEKKDYIVALYKKLVDEQPLTLVEKTFLDDLFKQGCEIDENFGLMKKNIFQICGEDRTCDSRIPPPEHLFWSQVNFVFVHIPKTAGTSIGLALPKIKIADQLISQHFWHLQAINYPTQVWSKLVTIVRNPYDRAVSAYFYFKEGGMYHQEQWCLDFMSTYATFENWVIEGLTPEMTQMNNQKNYPSPLNPMILQTEWLLTYDRAEMIIPPDRIGRFENLATDCQRLFGLTKLDCWQPSRHSQWRQYYKDKPHLQEKIYQIYQRDFCLLGYSKEIEFN